MKQFMLATILLLSASCGGDPSDETEATSTASTTSDASNEGESEGSEEGDEDGDEVTSFTPGTTDDVGDSSSSFTPTTTGDDGPSNNCENDCDSIDDCCSVILKCCPIDNKSVNTTNMTPDVKGVRSITVR